MYAQLGDIVFEKLLGFNSFETTGSEKYAEHALINLQPRLDHTGTDLRSIKFDVRFHANYCVPEQKSAALWVAKNTASILTLVLGNGRIIGDFVITEITDNLMQTFDDGTYIELVSSISLKECVVADKKTQDQQSAQNSAAAVTSNKPDPLRNFPVQTPTLTGQTTNFMLHAIWAAAEIEYLVVIAAADPTTFALHTLEARTSLGDLEDNIDNVISIIGPAYTAAQTALVAFVDWTTENSNILAACADTLTSQTALSALMPMTSLNIGAVGLAATALSTSTTNLRLAAINTFIQHGLRRL
jgi:phage protein U